MLPKKLILAVFVVGMTGTSLLAGPMPATGSFSMSGIVTVTTTNITWETDAPGNAANLFTLTLGAQTFSDEDGQNQIENLTDATEPVGGSGFAGQDFINFLEDSTLADLNIDYIAQGLYSPAGCASPIAVGDTCTPQANGMQGLFNFTDTAGGGSTATWVFEGTEAGYPNYVWVDTFTAQFTLPYQSVLAELGSQGYVTNSYSSSLSVYTTPEPSPLIMVGFGFGLLALQRVVVARRRNANSVKPPVVA
jgi:hypothetical protein